MEQNVWHAPVIPCAFQQGLELEQCAIEIDVRPADGGKRRVPGPLMGIEMGGWHRVGTAIIVDEDAHTAIC